MAQVLHFHHVMNAIVQICSHKEDLQRVLRGSHSRIHQDVLNGHHIRRKYSTI